MSKPYSNLVELLLDRSEDKCRQPAYTFLKEDGQVQDAWTYSELGQRARAVAAQLQQSGCSGQPVLMLYNPGLEFIAGFWGCVLAGAIAVPAYPPRSNRNVFRLRSIVQDSCAKALLTTSQLSPRIQEFGKDDRELASMQHFITDLNDVEAGSTWKQPELSGNSIAFLQYTSGSTAEPKGVAVSHSNLLHNEARIQEAFRQTAHSIIVGWLPVYHDMGLIGNLLQSLYVGARCILMSPVTFLQQPVRWLEAISRYQATTSGGPNFAYDLCVRKISDEEIETLDLSSWEVAFNGAEPVRPETLQRFSERFSKVGFRSQAFFPCYGLAEATLLVSAKPGPVNTLMTDADALCQYRVQAPSNNAPAKPVINCGRTASSDTVVIVDPLSLRRRLPDEIGEIWIAGPSVARGYWNRKEESQSVFEAMIAGTDEGPFLRTGDLGFIKNDELFITGRLKDMIILRGRNHYPQDIEATVAASHPGLRAGCGAAFAVDDGSIERLVIVQEAEHGRNNSMGEATINAIRSAVAEQHDIHPHNVVLLRSGSIPKTSSGKIQRHACRKSFLAGDLKTIAEWHSAMPDENIPDPADSLHSTAAEVSTATEIEEWLVHKLAAMAGLHASAIDRHGSISRYGLDSLVAIELAHAIERELRRTIAPAKMLDGISIAELAKEISRSGEECGEIKPPQVHDIHASLQEFELSEGQKSLWFLYELAPESTAYNLNFAAWIKNGLDSAALRRIFEILIARHPSLRTTFHLGSSAPFQRINQSSPSFFQELDISTMDEHDLQHRLEEQAKLPFDLKSGPAFRVVVFRRSSSEYCILFSLHHIVADLWSLALLMHEFTLLHAAEADGSAIALAPVTLTYSDYVQRQKARISGVSGEGLFHYWRHQLNGAMPELDFPLDHPRPPVQSYKGASCSFHFDSELSRGIRALSQQTGATLYTVLLAVFQLLLHRYSNQDDILVGSPTSGRERADWTNVVGYFVNPVVIRTRLSGNKTFLDFLEKVRSTVAGAIKHQDYPFFKLVEQLQPQRDPSRSPVFQVMFALEKTIFLEKEGISTLAAKSSRSEVQFNGVSLQPVPVATDAALFDLMFVIAEDQDSLCGFFQYNTDLFEAETIQQFSRHYMRLAQQAVQNPGADIVALQPLDQHERQEFQGKREFMGKTRGQQLGSLSQLVEVRANDVTELPRSPVEDQLCDIFAAVLSQKQVGRNDDFFDLGGHSLLATQIISRIESSFSIRLPLRTLFESPTPAELAERVEEAIRHERKADVPAMLPVSRDIPMPLSFAQQRLWLLDQLEPGSYFYNSAAAVRLRGPLDITAVSSSFSEIARRHEVLRTTFRVENGVPVQDIAPAQPVTIPLVDLTGIEDQQKVAEDVARREAELPFDLGRGPLLRVQVVRLASEDHLLLLTMHHIISDAWSIKILIREFTAFYRAFTLGEIPQVPVLPIQYADFSYWQRNWMNGEVLEKYVRHWRSKLAGVPVLQLKMGKGASDFRGGRGRNDWFDLNIPAIEVLTELGRERGATLFTTMLAVFQVLLHEYSLQEDFAVGIHLAGRNHVEAEDLIGFFVNMMPVRADLSGNPTFEQLLDRVRAAVLDAHAYQDLPFDKLVQEIKPPRVDGRPQMFQAAFAMQNEPLTIQQLPNLQAEILDSGEETVRLGLVLWIMATPGGLNTCWRYNTSIFQPAEIEQFNKDFVALVKEIALRPDVPLSEIRGSAPIQSRQNSPDEQDPRINSTRISFHTRKRNPVHIG